jgi:hypothetical protein
MPALLDVKCHAGYGAKDLYFHFEIQNKIFKNKNHSVSRAKNTVTIMTEEQST